MVFAMGSICMVQPAVFQVAQLPETGSEDSNLAIFGLASLLAGFGLYGTKRRKR